MKYYTLYLDESTVEEIRKESKKEKRSLSNYIDLLLSEHLRSKEIFNEVTGITL